MTENIPTPQSLWLNDDAVFFDFLDAREAALNGAVGCFMVANVPNSHLRAIAQGTTSEILGLAARIALYQRGEDWNI